MMELELKKKVLEQAPRRKLGEYIWTYGIGPQMGYSFSIIHALAYSFIGFQTMYIATNWNPIYWNTACLIVNSGSLEEDEWLYEEDDEGNVFEKKEKTTDYAKIAKALGDIIARGIQVSLVDINKSASSFKPDTENNQILFGMKALSGINTDTITQVLENRPYANIADFMNKCKLNKTAMISLIKSGAFDKITKEWGTELSVEPRKVAMTYYLSKTCEPKKRLTLQNFNGLIQHNLIPEDLDFQRRVYNFNKFLKANKKVGKYYIFDDACMNFYEQFFDTDKLEVINGCTCILQTAWDKIYQVEMDAARDYLKDHQDDMLKRYNQVLFKEEWDKYAQGSISAWEMEALCFYYHDHELKNVDTRKYGLVNFFDLSPNPEIDTVFKRNGKDIPIFKTYKIVGTVINKNDTRSSIALLTTEGIVNVKFTKEYFSMFNRQLSEKQEDGTKKVMEKGWFGRGNKVLVTGFRRDDTFVAKTYSKTPTHQLYKITEVQEDGSLELTHDRYGISSEE